MLSTAFLVLTLCTISLGVDWDVETVLDEYVNREDGHFSYEVIAVHDRVAFTVHVLNMTSLKWMDDDFSSQSVWWHYLSIFIPKQIVYRDAAFLFNSMGSNDKSPPEPESPSGMRRTGQFAANTGAVSAYLMMNPNQPIYFPDDPGIGRVEDFIIGYTWRLFIEDENDELGSDIILQLPMTKVAKKALDAMHDYTLSVDPTIDLQRFMPSGYSKRGWATWLLGCVDRRVFAMVPTVFDLLNMVENLDHHHRSYHGWSWAFFPYWQEDVSRYLRHPRVAEMAFNIDPITFIERLTMPKMLALGTGDQFFLPSGTHYFWDRLQGPKYLQVFENDDHGLSAHRALLDHNMQAFFISVLENFERPTLTWQRTENNSSGSIVLTSSMEPAEIKAWWADTPDSVCELVGEARICRRDFRLTTVDGPTGILWEEDTVQNLGNGQYKVENEKRMEDGYRAFFIEASFPGPRGYTMRYTTEVQVIPDSLPYPPCQTEEECKGRIV